MLSFLIVLLSDFFSPCPSTPAEPGHQIPGPDGQLAVRAPARLPDLQPAQHVRLGRGRARGVPEPGHGGGSAGEPDTGQQGRRGLEGTVR